MVSRLGANLKSFSAGIVWTCLACLCAPLAQGATPLPPGLADGVRAQDAPAVFTGTIGNAVDEFQAKNFAAARDILETVTSNPSFRAQPEETQHWAWQVFAQTEIQLHNLPAALSHAKQAADSSTATIADWHLRLAVAYWLGDTDQFGSMLKIANDWPASLGALGDPLVLGVLNRAARAERSGSKEDWHFQLLRALFASNWRPDPLAARMDYSWLDLARELLDRGQENDAAAAASAIQASGAILEVRIDKRFDSLVAANPDHFDPVSVATDEIASAQEMVDAQPDRLAAVNRLSDALLVMEQQDKVLQLTEAALAKALPADGSRSAYTDLDAQLNWTMDYRQRALFRVGRFEEALAIQRKAARRPEGGRLNVSQAINLGGMYYTLGRPKEALAAIADITERDVSGYGALAADEVRVCAAVQLHDANLIRTRLAAMAAHARDGVAPYTSALLCVNDQDTLAKFYIDLLADKKLRTDALMHLQTFSLDKPNTAMEAVAESRRIQFLARPDLQAALKEVGRSMTWAMSRPPA